MNDDGTIGVHNEGHTPIKGWGGVEGYAIQAEGHTDASLIVSFHGEIDPTSNPNYTVLDTDYDTYSVVYSCGDKWDAVSFDFVWVLAREKHLDDATWLNVVAKIDEKLPNYNWFKNAKLTGQGKYCPYEKR